MKAIALVSGGLDSTLAARLVKEQGIEVIALHFEIPFCVCGKNNPRGSGNPACGAVTDLGLELKTIDISNEFLDTVKNPKHGYGKNLNPCIDCRILMLRKAKELMAKIGADFLVTGEVLGQRPMSQYKHALELIDKESGLKGLVLRPLSAKILPPTIPEKEGWVDAHKLLGFQGRSRRPQMDLAEAFDIRGYSSPAGGCLLTEPLFVSKVRDLIDHKEFSLGNIELLKIGRHFRLGSKTKLIAGRDEKENERLSSLAKKNDYLFSTRDIPGPVALGRGVFTKGLIELSCGIVCCYSDLDPGLSADIVYRKLTQERESTLKVSALEDSRLSSLKI